VQLRSIPQRVQVVDVRRFDFEATFSTERAPLASAKHRHPHHVMRAPPAMSKALANQAFGRDAKPFFGRSGHFDSPVMIGRYVMLCAAG
jgi:hypothetical protein